MRARIGFLAKVRSKGMIDICIILRRCLNYSNHGEALVFADVVYGTRGSLTQGVYTERSAARCSESVPNITLSLCKAFAGGALFPT